MIKKFLFVLFSIFLLSISSYSALANVPLVVYGTATFDGQIYNGAKVYITSGSDVWTTVTNENGIYTVDATNLKRGSGVYVKDGDSLKIRVCPSSISGCEKVVVASSIPTKADFEVSSTPEIEEVVADDVSSDGLSASVDVFYGQEVSFEIGDNKLSKLQDTEIEFDSEDYDIEELIKVEGKIETSLDDEDFGDEPYFVAENIMYSYVLETSFPESDVSESESLIINLLGESVEIIEIKSNEFTLLKGKEQVVSEGESVVFEGKELIVETIGEDFIFVKYGGENAKIKEGDIEDIGGVEVYVSDVMEDDTVADSVVLRIAEDVKETIVNGDDYEDSEVWEWVVDFDSNNKRIGVVNQETFNDLEEENKPVKSGEKIVLPNGFTEVSVSSSVVDYESVSFKVKDEGLRISGSFVFGSEDYSEVYLKSDGFYDDHGVLITKNKLGIDGTEHDLEFGSAVIGKLKVLADMSDILYDGVSFAGEDGLFLTYDGLIFDNVEDAVEDAEGFVVEIPEERPELTISVGEVKKSDGVIVMPEPVPMPGSCECEKCSVEECEEVKCPEIKPVECSVCKECEECKEPEGNSLAAIIGSLLAGIGGLGIGGLFIKRKEALGKGVGLKIYTKRDGKEGVLHKHPGIVGYHDPETKHRDKDDRHTVGELTPKYVKDETGKWVYVE